MTMNQIKRAAALTLVTLFAIFATQAQSRQTRQEYINRYKHIAVAHMEKYGIPASITMAQGVLESDSGNSILSGKSNNHFGIKCKSSWTGERVYHDDDAKDECFRAYPTVEMSYADHAEFLDNSPRYDSLFDLRSDDYKGWARGLKKAGYATAPDYAERLIKIIEDNDLQLLDQRDGEARYAALHGGTTVSTSQDGWFADAGGVDPNNFETTINAHKGYNVHRNNEVFFIVAKKGDTFAKIAEFFMISQRRLLAYNDLPRKAQPTQGDKIYIARKSNKWRGDDTTTHTVTKGETLHSVAQDYAMTVKSLRKLNKLEVKHTLTEGQKLKLK